MSRVDVPLSIAQIATRIIVGLWFAAMGFIGSIMLYNEIFDPEWGRANKQRFSEVPPWYIDLAIGIGAAVCFYLAYRLIIGSLRSKKGTTERE